VIDFRYHLVSIIAVFLALAIGILVGANALRPATETFLGAAAKRVTQQNTSLRQQNKILQEQVNADQQFAQAASGHLLGHLLADQSVVLVTAPGADGSAITGVTTALQQAGAHVTGTLAFQAQFFLSGDSTETKLTQLAQSLAPDVGVTLPGQSNTSAASGQEQAAQVIAAAIVSKNDSGLTQGQTAVLGGFGQSGYLQISPAGNQSATSLAPASLAVVVAPATPAGTSGSSPANLALIAIAEQLQAAGRGAVLVDTQPGSGPGSAIDAVAGQGKVSTVDDVDRAVGQIVTVQALSELLSGKPPTSYGVGPGAVPSPAPSPSASPTATTSEHVRQK
jgi:hypothetical protein